MALTRLQKLLSERGVASRRKAEDLIAQGKVRVNGIRQAGDSADPYRDLVTVSGKKLPPAEAGCICCCTSHAGGDDAPGEKGRRCVAELVRNVGVRVFPVGRLDRDSEGLLLLTNDGDFANAMMHPAAHIPKTYRVTLRADVTPGQMQQFREGMPLDGRMTAPAEFDIVSYEPGGDGRPPRTVVQIVLYEGRNRQIRRMCEELGLEVTRLRRIAVGTVKLGMLPAGKWRHLQPKEVRELLEASKVDKKIAASYIKQGREGAARAHHHGRR